MMGEETVCRDLLRSLAVEENGLLLLPIEAVRRVEQESGLTRREVEILALEEGVLPRRYMRNYGTLGLDGQLRLLRSRVAVIGLGGLGGYVVEGLARMGVGQLVLMDGDTFVDHNLNRQLLSGEPWLGRAKPEVAAERVRAVNAAVEVIPRAEYATEENLPTVLEGVDVVVDALDRLPTRLMLQRVAAEVGVPMVHGAIAGWIGQVMTIFPGDPGLRALYGEEGVPERGLEARLGTPAATPMAVAAWEVQEVVKVLTGKGEPLRGRLLVMDAESGTVEVIRVG